MEESSEKNMLRSNRLFYAGIGFALLFAITWGLPSFFNWLFFLTAAYTFFLSWYIKPRAPRADYFRSSQRAGTQQPYDYQTPARDPKALVRRALVIVAFTVFGIFFLLFLIGVFVGGDDESATAYDTIPDEYQEALKANPNDLEALTNIGNKYLEDGQYDSAHVYYDRILKIDSRNSAALFNKGLIHYNLQQYSQSIDFLKRCINANPDNADAYLILGHDYYDQQQQDESFQWYSKAYDKGMKNAFLSHVLAYLYDNKGNTVKAVPLYKEAVQLDSSRAEVYTRLAELEPANAAQYTALAEKWKNN